MATTEYSTEYNGAYVEEPSVKIQPGDYNGKLNVIYAEYVVVSDLTINSVIKMCKLPAGARVHSAIIATDGSLGGSSALDLGFAANGVDTADPDAFFDGLDTSSAAAIGEMNDVAAHAAILKQFTVETDVEVKVVAAFSSATPGDKIKVAIGYSFN